MRYPYLVWAVITITCVDRDNLTQGDPQFEKTMSNANGIITAPVSWDADVAYVLGSNNPDLGSLCTHPNIKMWSKAKPYRDSTSKATSAAARAAAKYGLSVPTLTLSQMQQAGRDWLKLLPREEYGEWYRAADFDGYNHGATDPSFSMQVPQITNNKGGNIIFGSIADGSDLTIGDFVSNTLASGIDTHYPNPPYSLDDFFLMFVVFAGSTVHVYNTGQHFDAQTYGATRTFTFADQAFYDVAAGADCLVVACLALTDYLSVGDHKLDLAGPDADFYSNTLFIPLNLTGASAIGERSMKVTHWDQFSGMGIGSCIMHYPSTGYVQWKVDELVLGCDSIGQGGPSFTFYVRLYIYRNGQLVPVSGTYPSYDETVTGSYDSVLDRWYFVFTQNFLITAPQFDPATDRVTMEVECNNEIILSTDVTAFVAGPRTN